MYRMCTNTSIKFSNLMRVGIHRLRLVLIEPSNKNKRRVKRHRRNHPRDRSVAPQLTGQSRSSALVVWCSCSHASDRKREITKHIVIRYHFLRDYQQKEDIEISYINTKNQLADIFTKPLDEQSFNKLRHELNILNSNNFFCWFAHITH
jgi:hypothetical protein